MQLPIESHACAQNLCVFILRNGPQMKQIIKYIACLICVALTACAAPPTREILANPDDYLAKNFSVTALTPEIRAKLKLTGTPKAAKSFKVTTVMTIESNKQEKTTYDRILKVNTLDNGLVQTLMETSNNGIVNLTSFFLDYGYLGTLKEHEVFNSSSGSSYPYTITSVTKLDKELLAPSENSSYSLEFEMGTPVQIAGFPRIKSTCTTGKHFDASELLPKLKGKAMYFDCQHINMNNAVSSKSKLLALLDYGFSIKVEDSNSSRKRTWTITNIQ